MARLPALIDLITSFGDVERKTVEGQARALRDAGLITPSKRGVGAAHVTLDDAAMLLLASMSTSSVMLSPEIVQVYADLGNDNGINWFDDGLLLPTMNKSLLLYYPLYYAPTAFSALKIMISYSDRCWNFCDYDSILGHEHEFDLENRQVSVTLNTTHRLMSVEIKDLHTIDPTQIGTSSALGANRVFTNRTQFRMTWAELGADPFRPGGRPRRTSAVTVSGEALYDLNQLIKAP